MMNKGVFEGPETKLKRLEEHESTLLEARAFAKSDLEILDKVLADILEKKTALKEQIG